MLFSFLKKKKVDDKDELDLTNTDDIGGLLGNVANIDQPESSDAEQEEETGEAEEKGGRISGLDRLKRDAKKSRERTRESEELKQLDEARMYRSLIGRLYDTYTKREYASIVEFVNRVQSLYEVFLKIYSKQTTLKFKKNRLYHSEFFMVKPGFVVEAIVRNIEDPIYSKNVVYNLECKFTIPVLNDKELYGNSETKINNLATLGSGELKGMYKQELKDFVKILNDGFKDYK